MTTTDSTPIPAPSPTPPTKKPHYNLSDISYRRATLSDYELLKRYRVECGWGLERMEKDLRDEGGKGDTPLWIFSVPTLKKDGKGPSAGEEDVGMGGLVLDSEGQRYMADRESRTVKLCESQRVLLSFLPPSFVPHMMMRTRTRYQLHVTSRFVFLSSRRFAPAFRIMPPSLLASRIQECHAES
jgi:hypothetical protein